jgi:hypothetical protein
LSNYRYKSNLKIKNTLIKSISGIRGTIGGVGDNLTPVDAVKIAPYGTWLKNYSSKSKLTVVWWSRFLDL